MTCRMQVFCVAISQKILIKGLVAAVPTNKWEELDYDNSWSSKSYLDILELYSIWSAPSCLSVSRYPFCKFIELRTIQWEATLLSIHKISQRDTAAEMQCSVYRLNVPRWHIYCPGDPESQKRRPHSTQESRAWIVRFWTYTTQRDCFLCFNPEKSCFKTWQKRDLHCINFKRNLTE